MSVISLMGVIAQITARATPGQDELRDQIDDLWRRTHSLAGALLAALTDALGSSGPPVRPVGPVRLRP